jgi:hypothetical protein
MTADDVVASGLSAVIDRRYSCDFSKGTTTVNLNNVTRYPIARVEQSPAP